jgi:RimJ/RimL family protein N-acetyltransferase
MLEPITLEGQTVTLAPLASVPPSAVLAAASEDRSVYRYADVPSDDAGVRLYLEAAQQAQARGAALPFAIIERASGRVVGSTRFLNIEHWTWPPEHPLRRIAQTPDVVEIGDSWLAASALGGGTHLEVSLMQLTHAFETWRVRRVALRCDARNERARRAIEKLGVRFDGVLRAACIASDGAVQDVASYTVLDLEWRAVKSGLVRTIAPKLKSAS